MVGEESSIYIKPHSNTHKDVEDIELISMERDPHGEKPRKAAQVHKDFRVQVPLMTK